jgi:hypothetical protein
VDGNSNELVTFSDAAVTNNSTQDITAPTVSSRTVNAAGTNLAVVFNETVTEGDATGWAFVVAGVSRGLTYASGTGTNTINFTIASTVGVGQVCTLAYDSGTGNCVDGNNNELVTFTATAVTNNSTQDITKPTIVSAETNVEGTETTVVFSEIVTASSGFQITYSNGLDIWLKINIGPASGSGTDTLVFSHGEYIAYVGGTMLLDYNTGTGDCVDGNNNELAAVSDLAITNNAIEEAPSGRTVIVKGGIIRSRARLTTDNVFDGPEDIF